tara:strand:- start:974 stop:2263 length:1290 start_codon:yes stop_codon:yes gene_type:complete
MVFLDIRINLTIKMLEKIRKYLFLLLIALPFIAHAYDDRIIVVVNDSVILKSEVQHAINNLSQEEITKEYSTLSEREIIDKVIEKMIERELILQAAERYDINISDIALENKIQEIANKQNVTTNELRNLIISNGLDYQTYIKKLKDEMTMDALFVSQFYSRANVTEEEVDNFMAREKINEQGNIQYEILEFVINDEEKNIDRDSIDKIHSYVTKTDFTKTKEKYNQYDIKIRNLGVVNTDNLPSLYINALKNINPGEYTEIIRSSKGYHILRVLSAKNQSIAYIDEYKVRHILIKPDPMTSDREVKEKLFELRNKISSVEEFADNAKKYSTDLASAYNGGDLNWQRSKNLVAEFSSVMENTPLNTISDPFSTQFGWHILYVENKRTVDDARSIIRNNVANTIRANKAKREKDNWKAKLKDQAFIEIKEF